jgi:hypothetical protein
LVSGWSLRGASVTAGRRCLLLDDDLFEIGLALAIAPLRPLIDAVAIAWASLRMSSSRATCRR